MNCQIKFNVIQFFTFTLILSLRIDNVYSQNYNDGNSSNKIILKTDSLGNILGGDINDWDFSNTNYKNREKYDYLSVHPIIKILITFLYPTFPLLLMN